MIRGIVRSSLFALLIGMTFMIAAPRDAGAITGWVQTNNFPTGLIGLSSGGYEPDMLYGLTTALNQSQNPQIQSFFNGDGANSDDGGYNNGDASTVPEPATWIMIILGIGIVAWRLRRRGRGGRGALPAHA